MIDCHALINDLLYEMDQKSRPYGFEILLVWLLNARDDVIGIIKFRIMSNKVNAFQIFIHQRFVECIMKVETPI